MSVTEQVEQPDQSEPAVAPPLETPLQPAPLTIIADGAFCTLDGTCSPA